MLAPFCPVRGWVCKTCGAHFDCPAKFVRHGLAKPLLDALKIKLDYVSATGNVVYKSRETVQYPVVQPTRMRSHAYVGFRYNDAVTRLLALRNRWN